MSLCAIIPIKPLRIGKSRLAGILNQEIREELNRFLLSSTLECLSGINKIQSVIVISYDPSALTLARKFGAKTVLEDRNTNINRALRKATLAARVLNYNSALIIPADLPLLKKEDVIEIIGKLGNPPEIIIVPDRKGNGTNALLINPIGAINYNFGDWSFSKHIEQAERKGINVQICSLKSLSFDLDLPEDWDNLKAIMKNDSGLIHKITQEAGK
jgi:2-phospho-L-lactate guanylyltransferase